LLLLLILGIYSTCFRLSPWVRPAPLLETSGDSLFRMHDVLPNDVKP